MVIHNLRSPEQWRIISSQIDFKGKSVIDLGCGWCDLLRFAGRAAAVSCVGVDKEHRSVLGVYFVEHDLEEWTCTTELTAHTFYDIALCFSVLPYLESPGYLLKWMSEHASISFIECQYAGDGPGLETLIDDGVMLGWLMNYWPNVKPIGHTVAKDRYERTIWMCE